MLPHLAIFKVFFPHNYYHLLNTPSLHQADIKLLARMNINIFYLINSILLKAKEKNYRKVYIKRRLPQDNAIIIIFSVYDGEDVNMPLNIVTNKLSSSVIVQL